MEIDYDILEVGVPENEFDGSFEDAGGCDNEEDMQTSDIGDDGVAKATEDKSGGGDKVVEGKQEDLRMKINDHRSRGGSESNVAERDKYERGKRSNKEKRRRALNPRGRTSDESNNKLYKPLDVSSDLDPKLIGREIAYRLGEMKVGLIINVVRVLGLQCAMEILEDTRKIERRGGLLTADGRRRRAPGGVYIHCLKERGYATKNEIEKIFKDEKERLKQKMKQKRKEETAKKKKEIEELTKLKKQVIDYVNMKLENDIVKESGNISEGEIQ